MRYYKAIFSALIVTGVLYACQKELSSSGINLGSKAPASLQTIFKESQKENKQSFVFPNNTAKTITGRKGTSVFFPVNSFVDQSGNVITGDVKIEMLEVLNPSDMILNNVTTTSDGMPLESGGAFLINASYNNQPVKLASGKYIKINLTSPLASVPGMQVFNGKQADTATTVNWTPNNNIGNIVVRDTFRVPAIFCDSVKWINCDKFINDPKIEYTFNCPDTKPDSTLLYAHFTGRNSVAPLYKGPGVSFTSTSLIAVPVSIIGISIKDGRFYTVVKSLNLTDHGSTTLTFQESTLDNLKKTLLTLH